MVDFRERPSKAQPSMTQLFRDLKPFIALGGRYWWRFALGFLLSVVVLISSIGLLGLSGWFITATSVAGLTVVTAQAFNFFTPGAGVRGFSIARTAGRYGERILSHDATFRLLAGLRAWFFNRLEPLVPSGLKRVRQSELMNRLVADIETLDSLYLRLISPLLLAVVAIAVLVGVAFFFNARIGGFLLLVLMLSLWLLSNCFFRLGLRPGQKIVETREHLRNRIMDYVSGLTELQVYGASGRYQRTIFTAEKSLQSYEWQMAQVSALSMVMIAMLIGISLGGVIWFGAIDVAGSVVAGHAQGPVIVMLALATLATFEVLAPLSAAFQILGQTQSAARRLLDITDQEPTVIFPTVGVNDAIFTGGKLELSRVTFAYPRGEGVLQDFSLTVAPEERVALIGPTGCGKSTLLQLITREWPCDGRITLGGISTDNLTELQLRRVMAVMPQRIHVFSASLRDNLLLAIDPLVASDVTDSDLLAVLADVGLDHLAPEDMLLDTWLGTVGQAMSGGEQRRLGLARVLLRLRDPLCTLVLLDEPTEGLDPETEQRMIALLDRALAGKTLLMVTHRPAALVLAQRTVPIKL